MQDLNIIHEDKNLIVVNKPSGIITEVSPFEQHTLEAQINTYLKETNPKAYLGVIHRLDRVTSGVILFAKKKSTLKEYNEYFSSKKVQKTYLAIVENKPKKTSEKLIHYLEKLQKEKRTLVVPQQNKIAKKAILSYKLIGKNEFGFLLEVKPQTGRFHQIRAQLSHIDCPIVGDEKYGASKQYKPLSICLHASSIHINNETVFSSSLPQDEFWKFGI